MPGGSPQKPPGTSRDRRLQVRTAVESSRNVEREAGGGVDRRSARLVVLRDLAHEVEDALDEHEVLLGGEVRSDLGEDRPPRLAQVDAAASHAPLVLTGEGVQLTVGDEHQVGAVEGDL